MAPAEQPSPHDLPDRAIRQTLRHPANLRGFLREVVPELADGFVYERLRVLEREFPLDDWRGRESDLLFELPYRVGAGERLALVCVLLEHRSWSTPCCTGNGSGRGGKIGRASCREGVEWRGA